MGIILTILYLIILISNWTVAAIETKMIFTGFYMLAISILAASSNK